MKKNLLQWVKNQYSHNGTAVCKGRNISMEQAEALQAKGKLGKAEDIVTSTMKRLREQQESVFKSRVIEEVKQFGSNVESLDIPQ